MNNIKSYIKSFSHNIFNSIKKNKLLTILLILIILLSLKSFITSQNNKKLEKENIKIKKLIKSENDSLKIKINILDYKLDSLKDILNKKYSFENYLEDIANRESSGNQYSINRYGMMGLYQFNPKTLSFLGYSKDNYLNSIKMQNDAMISYLKFNKTILKPYIEKYNGKYYNGIYITESGILAGAHLTGAGGVIEFFEKKGKYKVYDGNNVHISEYIEEFSGYNLAYLYIKN